jgi:hypothetical protein
VPESALLHSYSFMYLGLLVDRLRRDFDKWCVLLAAVCTPPRLRQSSSHHADGLELCALDAVCASAVVAHQPLGPSAGLCLCWTPGLRECAYTYCVLGRPGAICQLHVSCE